MGNAEMKQQVYETIDRTKPEQVAASVDVLEAAHDPYERALANAPLDDEPVTDEERREIAAARASFGRGEGVSNGEILAEFGLTAEEFHRLGRTPLEPDGGRS